VRLRATKAPLGLLSQPTRNIRVVQRTLCTPQQQLDQAALDTCLADAPTYANGLVAGQYYAPTFDYLFPENTQPGDPVVPFDLWHLPFLRYGEGAQTDSGVGPLEPTPWGAPVSALPPLPDPPAAPAPDPAAGGAAPVVAAAAPAAAAPAPAPAAAPAPAGGAAPGAVVAAAAGKAVPVAIALSAPATVPAAAAATTGLVVRFAAPAGVTSASLRVLRQRGRRATVLASQVVNVKRGVNKVALKAAALKRRRVHGLVVVEVRLRRADGRAGAPKRTAVRIV
jgi:hypothetical protein